MFRIGVDVGGTFTDYTVLDESAGQVYYHKVPSTPDDPSRAIRDGIAQLLEKYNIQIPVFTWENITVLRYSIHFYNKEEDLNRLIGAVKELLY